MCNLCCHALLLCAAYAALCRSALHITLSISNYIGKCMYSDIFNRDGVHGLNRESVQIKSVAGLFFFLIKTIISAPLTAGCSGHPSNYISWNAFLPPVWWFLGVFDENNYPMYSLHTLHGVTCPATTRLLTPCIHIQQAYPPI